VETFHLRANECIVCTTSSDLHVISPWQVGDTYLSRLAQPPNLYGMEN